MTNSTQTTTRRQAAARELVARHLNNRAARIISARVNASGVNTWQVQGSEATPYTVTLQPVVTCSCPDHARRHLPCKHILAVMELAGEQPQPVATVPAAPARTRRPRTEREEELAW